MYDRDYTIRLLQQMVVLLARLLGLKKSNDPEVLLIELEAAFPRFAGLPRSLALRMPVESLVAYFTVTGEFDADRCAMVALLLREEGSVAEMLGSAEDAAELRRRANALVASVLESPILSREIRDLLQKE